LVGGPALFAGTLVEPVVQTIHIGRLGQDV